MKEKDVVVITSDILSATDADTPDSFLVFDIIEYPEQGNVYVEGDVSFLYLSCCT